jgi:hypothetical protein
VTATLVRVACANCDGTIDAEPGPDDVDADAECPWCGARLRIHRAGGAAWTQLAEDAAAITARAEHARALTDALRVQRELATATGQWIEQRPQLTWWPIREPRPTALAVLVASLALGAVVLVALAVRADQLALAGLAGVAAIAAGKTPALALLASGTDRDAWRAHRARAAALRAQLDAVVGRDGPWGSPNG